MEIKIDERERKIICMNDKIGFELTPEMKKRRLTFLLMPIKDGDISFPVEIKSFSDVLSPSTIKKFIDAFMLLDDSIRPEKVKEFVLKGLKEIMNKPEYTKILLDMQRKNDHIRCQGQGLIESISEKNSKEQKDDTSKSKFTPDPDTPTNHVNFPEGWVKEVDGILLVQHYKVAMDIIKKYHFRTMWDNEEIYYFDGRVYRPGGERIIKTEVERHLKDFVTSHDINEIIGHVQRSTYFHREEFNKDVYLLSLENGVLDLRTGELHPHSPEFLFTFYIPVRYDPEADCPRIKKFLSEVLYPEDIPKFFEMLGFILFRDYPLQKFFVFYGTGGNGKSIAENIITAFIGKENISSVTLHQLVENRFAPAELFGKLLNIAGEVDKRTIKNTDILRRLTGGDWFTAEKKNRDPFTFKNYAKIIFICNELPKVTDRTDAFYRRCEFIQFPNQFIDNPRHAHELIKELTTPEELSGLLNEALKGLKRLLENRCFTNGINIEEAKEIWDRLSDPVKFFAELYLEKSEDDFIPKDEVYTKFLEFCNNKRLTPVGKNAFTERLKTMFPGLNANYRPKIAGKRVMCYKGIKWKTPDDEEDNDSNDDNNPFDEFDVNKPIKELEKELLNDSTDETNEEEIISEKEGDEEANQVKETKESESEDNESFIQELISEQKDLAESLLILDIETSGLSKERDEILAIGLKTPDSEYIFSRHEGKSEKEIIEEFLEKLNDYNNKENEYYLITYNGEEFDLPFIKAKCEKYALNFPFKVERTYHGQFKIDTKNNRAKYRNEFESDRIKHIDLYPLVTGLYGARRWQDLTLKTVTHELGLLRRSEREIILPHEIANVFKNDPEKVINYLRDDLEATFRLAIFLLPQEIEISKLTGVPLHKSIRMGNAQRIEALIRKYAEENNLKLPPPSEDDENISFTQYLRLNGKQGADVGLKYVGVVKNVANLDVASLYPSIMLKYGYLPDGREGVFYRVLKELTEKRLELKRKAKEEKNKGRRIILQQRQNALKLLINSFYGYQGTKGAIWRNYEMASKILEKEREIIGLIKEEVEKAGYDWIEYDTDGIWIFGGSEEELKALCDQINEKLPEGIVLEFDGFYPFGFFARMKNYAVGDPENCEFKGGWFLKGDNPPIVNEVAQETVKALLKLKAGVSQEKAFEKVRETLKRIKSGNLRIEEIKKKRVLTKPIEAYDVQSEHVKVARRLRELGIDVKEGDTVEFYISKDGVKPIIEFDPNDINTEYYYNEALRKAIEIIKTATELEEARIETFLKGFIMLEPIQISPSFFLVKGVNGNGKS